MVAQLCPACLSGVDAGAPRCGQCGADLTPPRRRWGRWLAATATLGALATLTVWGLQRRSGPGAGEPTPAATPPAATPRQPAPQLPAPQPAVSPHHVWLHGSAPDAPRVPALALTAGSGRPVLLLLALRDLPVEGTLLDERGGDVPVTVASYSLDLGFVLLSPQRLPEHVRPLVAGRLQGLEPGSAVELRTPSGATGAAALAGAGAPETELDRPAPAGSAVVAGGRAVALAVGGRALLPSDRLLRWLDDPSSRALGVVQTELRTWMPEHLLAEVARLAAKPTDAGRLAHALELLRRAGTRVRDSAELDRLDTEERQLTTNLVRLLSRTDRAAAWRRAREAVVRFPDEAPLIADAAVLAITVDPGEGLALLAQLRALSPAEARHIEPTLREALERKAAAWIDQSRLDDAITLLASAIESFPDGASLHAARARGLAAADRLPDAIAEATAAAQLDPSHADLLAQLQARQAQEAEGVPDGHVEIPVDPRSRVIRARVLVSGHAIEYVVDTGATMTTVPSAVAHDLGLTARGRVKVDTAGGVVEADLVEVPDLRLGPISVGPVQALVMDLPGDLAGKGLLGLNVLQKLDMQLTARGSKLVLRAAGTGRWHGRKGWRRR